MDTIKLASSLRSVVGALHKGLRKRSSMVKKFSMTEMETVGHLSRNQKLFPSELAALTRITTQSMSQILSKMEKLELINRTPSQDDKRKVYISLTVRGKKMVDETLYERDEWLKNEIEQTLSSKEKEILEKALPVLNKLLNVDKNGMV